MDYIYDFLYVDRDRIASFYSQLFDGHLVSFERIIGSTSQSSANISAKIPGIAEGGGKETQISKEERKEIINPHDAATADVLSKLIDIAKNSENPNVLILKGGKITFLDQNLLKIIFDSFELLDFIPLPKKEKKEVKQIKKMVNAIKKLVDNAPILPAFIFLTDNGQVYGGTLKENFLSEPIVSYYFKHQNKWLEDVSLVAIKENANNTYVFSDDHLMNIVGPYLEILSRIVFPERTVKVTPIAILKRV